MRAHVFNIRLHCAGAYLSNLKKIRRNKRNLRKSMEVMLQAQAGDAAGAPLHVAPLEAEQDVMQYVQYESSSSNRFLEELDSSVNQVRETKARSHGDRVRFPRRCV